MAQYLASLAPQLAPREIANASSSDLPTGGNDHHQPSGMGSYRVLRARVVRTLIRYTALREGPRVHGVLVACVLSVVVGPLELLSAMTAAAAIKMVAIMVSHTTMRRRRKFSLAEVS